MKSILQFSKIALLIAISCVAHLRASAAGTTTISAGPFCYPAPFTLWYTGSVPNPPLTFQWYNTGGAIPGATNSFYNGTVVTTYYLIVHNSIGSPFVSNTVTVTISNPSPTVSVNPNPGCTGQPVVFFVNPPCGTCTYQWYSGAGTSSPIAGATNVAYMTTYYTAGTYSNSVTQTDASGCVSLPATASVQIGATPHAPSITGGPTTFCTGSVGTSTLTANTACSSCTFEWSENGVPISGATTQIYNYTPPTTIGTYSVTVEIADYTNYNCSSTSPDFTVLVKDCCDPVAAFAGHPYTVIGSTGTISGAIPPGLYYMSSPTNIVTVTANTNITNATILIDPGTKIILAPGVDLLILGSNLFSCKMWEGIVVDPTSTLELLHSLISDANAAVYLSNLNSVNTVYNLTANGTLFNKNIIGIKVENSALVSTTGPSTFFNPPFAITGNAFTGLDLSSYPGYPYSWPTASYLMTQNSSNCVVTSNFYASNYNVASFPLTYCNNGLRGTAGIYLNNVGSTVGSGPGAAYNEIVIGDPNSPGYQNMFNGTSTIGIYAKNTNLSVYNNIFLFIMNGYPVPVGGDGVLAEADYNVQVRARIFNNGGANNNKFYSFDTKNPYLKISNYYDVTCDDNSFFGSFNFYPFPFTGSAYEETAIDIESWNYDNIDISNNQITHISDPIIFKATDNGGMQNAGRVTINNNDLEGNCTGVPYNTPPSISSPTWYLNSSGFIYKAITVSNSLSTAPTSVTGLVEINGNTIGDAYNGIFAGSFNGQGVHANNNTITMAEDPVTTNNQYGIEFNSSSFVKHEINNNSITGETPNIPQIDIARAIHVTNALAFNSVGCNSITDMGRHFDFDNCTTRLKWLYNQMIISGSNNYTSKGYVLDGGFIGIQGSAASACGNQWLGNWSSGSETYVAGSASPSSSQLYVDTGNPIEDPAPNNGTPPYSYSGGLATGATATPNCPMAKHSNNAANTNETNKMTAQSYSIYPNPSPDGDLQIRQTNMDNAPVETKILNAQGQSVFEGTLQFNNSTSSLALKNLTPGLYLMELKDSKGRYNVKFVITR